MLTPDFDQLREKHAILRNDVKPKYLSDKGWATLRSNIMSTPASNGTGSSHPSQDVEKTGPFTLDIENPTPPSPVHDRNEMEDNSNVPQLSILRIFWLFFSRFGIFAWGGPVAQIALIKEELVQKEQWITMPRFIRVFAVYQILPGPEAAELCMFFGCLSGGRWGGLAGGLGFMLPGFVLMLVVSYVYNAFGFGNVYFDASFRALQPMVAALVCFF